MSQSAKIQGKSQEKKVIRKKVRELIAAAAFAQEGGAGPSSPSLSFKSHIQESLVGQQGHGYPQESWKTIPSRPGAASARSKGCKSQSCSFASHLHLICIIILLWDRLGGDGEWEWGKGVGMGIRMGTGMGKESGNGDKDGNRDENGNRDGDENESGNGNGEGEWER